MTDASIADRVAEMNGIQLLPRLTIEKDLGGTTPAADVVLLASDGTLVIGKWAAPGCASMSVRLSEADLRRLRRSVDAILTVGETIAGRLTLDREKVVQAVRVVRRQELGAAVRCSDEELADAIVEILEAEG